MDRYLDGFIGISLTGGIGVSTVISRSSLPVGPVFKITEANDNEIITLTDINDAEGKALPPLVALENVLNNINSDYEYQVLSLSSSSTPSSSSSSSSSSLLLLSSLSSS